MRHAGGKILSFIVSGGATILCAAGCSKPKCPEGAVLIPPGTFVMGSDTAFAISDHSPAHRVTLTKNYCIDRTEVTMGAFARCVRAKKCEYDDTVLDMGKMKPNWPMDFVNWQDAANYCRAQGGRLPTDAEWEFAARGTDGRIYPWGNDPPTAEHWHIQLQRGIPTTVTDVGIQPKGRSFFGVDDMSGNLSEWVADACHLFTSEPAIDPKGPSDSDGKCRIKRGAGWSAFNAGWARATMRFLFRWPLDRDYETGFRCAYDPR